MVGQMGLVDGSPRSATCVAKGDVEALSINQVTFEQILKEAIYQMEKKLQIIWIKIMENLIGVNGQMLKLIMMMIVIMKMKIINNN